MTAHYMIAGRSVSSHWLSIATLGITTAGVMLAMSGKTTTPAVATDPQEEKFIRDYVQKAEAATKKSH